MSDTEVQTEAQVEITDDLDAFANDFFGEKRTASPAAKPEAEQDDQSTQADAGTDDPVNDEAAELAEEYVEPTPKKKTVQDRIDEVVRQREDTKRDLQAQLAAQKAEFEAKIAALQPQKQANQADAEPSPEAVTEAGDAKYPLGEFDPAYIRDLTRYTLNAERTQANQRAEQERQQAETRVRAEALQATWNTKVEAAKTTYPDLVEKAQPLLDSFSDLNSDYASYLATVLQGMDHGPDVLYYLSSNPAEARTIVNSGAQKATLALGRIEAKFLEEAAQKAAAKPRFSKAPPPPTASARGTGGGGNTIAPDTDDLDAFSSVFFNKPGRRK